MCLSLGDSPELARCFFELLSQQDCLCSGFFMCVCVVSVFQVRQCVPTTWRTWPKHSQGVSKSRNPLTPPGRLSLRRGFPSLGTTAAHWPTQTHWKQKFHPSCLYSNSQLSYISTSPLFIDSDYTSYITLCLT